MLRLASSALALAAVAALSTGCIIETDDGDSDFTIYNDSDYALIEINLAPVDQVTWGPNLLRGDVLLPDESLTIVSIECDTYDVRVVDDLNSECILADVDLCFDSDGWSVTNTVLDFCDFTN
jgi:hypothetical protein